QRARPRDAILGEEYGIEGPPPHPHHAPGADRPLTCRTTSSTSKPSVSSRQAAQWPGPPAYG
ncbi:hypothetical protein ABT408_38120, partial [Streptomyces halstedii]|uniref:hypothetical protein n=1 Tax=Streptomyces halstedii TaxID=1944 RepID=UPI00334CF908